MTLLLFLSAMLSALTGVGATDRGAVPQAVSRALAVERAVTATVVMKATQPAQSLPTLADLTLAAALPSLRFGVLPLYASRRRE